MRSCTFIGHHDCDPEISGKLYKTIEDVIVSENIRTFFVGTHGNFDRLVYSVLCELEENYEIKIAVVLAYRPITSDSAYYDMSKSIYPYTLHGIPRRFAIKKRNDRSCCIVCCVDHGLSNTSKFVTYAKKKKLQIINVGKFDVQRI